MAELTDLLSDLAARPAPPTGLRADELFTLGRRRRRRRRVAGVTGAALAVVLVLVSAVLWRPSGGPAPAPAVGVSSSAVRAGAAPSWTVVIDATHAYATVPRCPAGAEHCEGAQDVLRATDDGGRTWTERSVVDRRQVIKALSKDALLAAGGLEPMRLSIDGGRSWTDLADGSAAVQAVPAGGALVCRTPDMRQNCKLSVVDPQTRRLSPLTRQPDLIMATVYNVADPWGQIVQGGDRILVAGADRRTGRAAVAVSGDRGRTWSTHVFTDLPCPNDNDCGRDVSVQSTPDGSTGYAVVVDTMDKQRMFVYRQQPGGGWARSGDAIALGQAESFYRSFVAADGTHLLGLQMAPQDAPPRLRYVGLRAGAYQDVDLAGLPATAMPVHRSAGGVFYTYDQPGRTLHWSADGRSFTRFPLG